MLFQTIPQELGQLPSLADHATPQWEERTLQEPEEDQISSKLLQGQLNFYTVSCSTSSYWGELLDLLDLHTLALPHGGVRRH